jgi:hypothetical protein
MVNYQNSVIYKISCKDEITDRYVGSTTSHLKMKSRHKSQIVMMRRRKNIIIHFIDSFATWRVEKLGFHFLEEYPCRTKKQLNIRERYWFEKLNATLNDKYPDRGKVLEQKKVYIEKLNEKGKVKIECPCGSTVSKSNFAKHKRSQKHQEWEENPRLNKVL